MVLVAAVASSLAGVALGVIDAAGPLDAAGVADAVSAGAEANAVGLDATPFALARSIDASTSSAASRATRPAMRNARANDDAGSRARQFGQKLETGSTRAPQAGQRTRRCTDPDSHETVTVGGDASAVRAA
ncbi:MAG: hypothetical protein E6J38_09210 [Chloroflexi bacterium]|nr:MAG: hypothetical protein E6J38_09210 [Chloroflexota bacterium]TMC29659.1 MAG: hypothetical protein E6J27_04915 [Chloroflexota bacterium]TMC58495.1 MAG: hypothetical protein E6J19_02960 [Chloroflexota bacterium]